MLFRSKDMYNEGLCIAIKDYGAEEPCDVSMDINNLSRLTSNAFAGFSNDEKDKLSLALYLAKKLIAKLDPDDDDDMECLTNIMYSALLNDDKCQVLDFCKEADIDFTMPIHSGGSVFCIRDKCLGGNYGVKTIKKFIELGVDMDMAVIQGKTPANIVASQEPRHMMFRREKDDYFEKAVMFFSKESMEQLDNSGVSAVHQAAQRGHLEMLKVMIEKGVDVNVTQDAPAEAGNTPLHCACMYGHGDVGRIRCRQRAAKYKRRTSGTLCCDEKAVWRRLRVQGESLRLKGVKNIGRCKKRRCNAADAASVFGHQYCD